MNAASSALEAVLNDELQLAIDFVHQQTAIYTAEPIVDRLLDMLDWGEHQRLIDPSAGDGAFLTRALQRLIDAGFERFNDLPDLIQGWEIHAGAVEQARARISSMLQAASCSVDDSARIAARIVQHGDFLKDAPDVPAWNSVGSNPPYLKYAKLPHVLRKRYESLVPRYASHDLMYSFMDKSVKCLLPGGKIGIVVADRVLTNANAGALREEMGKRVGITHLQRLDVASSFYRAKTRRAGTLPRCHPVALVLADRRSGMTQIPLSSAPIYPGSNGAETAQPSAQTLCDIAEVRMAPWLGAKGSFQVNAEVAATLPANSIVPAIETSEVADGTFRPGKWYAIKTDPALVPPAAVREHLDRERHRMPRRGLRPNPWMPPESFHNWDLSKPSLLIPRVARTLKPIRVPAGILPLGHSISIPYSSQGELERLEALLNSPESQQWFESRAARLENGFYAIGAKLLRQLPVLSESKDCQCHKVK